MDAMRPTVYVVEDDDATRLSLDQLVEAAGFDVVTYRDGRQFLDDYEPGRPGCLVSDVRMPVMGGLDLQRELCKR